MDWTVVVPFKPGDRKSRLAPALDEQAREALAERMVRHVLATVASVARPLLLAHERLGWWTGDWRDDEGLGLNPAIGAARHTLMPGRFVIVHGDLPRLRAADLQALLDAAETHGLAIAPDRHGTGTNAIAIADARPFRFAFGAGSFARHRAQGGAIVERGGLALDIDTLDDLEIAGLLPSRSG